ncbi:hypothetical protein COCNU_14G005040 [Cocos nucifera]|uniref:PGG domain-containing protein n=1 Tax=Cocos nucifera TaxID=13894 RepID=A0A8K0NBQ0_COCNU|nr:hypothetical protein COCNU_14G005040 [Cocos nucifera]
MKEEEKKREEEKKVQEKNKEEEKKKMKEDEERKMTEEKKIMEKKKREEEERKREEEKNVEAKKKKKEKKNKREDKPKMLTYSLERRNSAEVCIASCLVSIKALSGPQELHDLESGELSSDEAKEKPSNFKEKSSCSKAERKPSSSSTAKGKPSSSSKAGRKPSSSNLAMINSKNPIKKKKDRFKENSSHDKGDEIGRQVNLARNLGIAAVLIATVTFAAGFTLPGGHIADDHPGRGTAVLANEYTFKAFLISDAFTLLCSIIATCWLMYAGTSIVDRHIYSQTSPLWGCALSMGGICWHVHCIRDGYIRGIGSQRQPHQHSFMHHCSRSPFFSSCGGKL